MKQISSVLLSLAMTLCMLTPMVSAAEITTAGGTNEVPVELTQEATAFSVTVPTVLPVDVSATGVVTVATDNKIVNNSFGPVEVKDIELVSLNDWVLQEFSTDFKTKKVGIKEYGFQMNGEDVATDGSCSADSFGVIPGKNEISFSYNANIASQNTAIEDEYIAQVIFTMGWSEVGLLAGLYDANGVLLCSWEDSGIDVETDYDNYAYQTKNTSGYYVLTNKYPTATKVVLPTDITTIGDRAFFGCAGIASVVIPTGVTTIGEWAFSNCNFPVIIIPESVTSIEYGAFRYCWELSSILYQGTQEQWNNIGKGSIWDEGAGCNVGGYTITYNYQG